MIIDTVRTYLGGTDQTVSECRHCGTTVESKTERCPECDHETIVRYHVG
ncbi:hypothetical protein [Halalkalicoccus jeotgali]|uniref:Small CPxCG-related zinc finger protein n=1 Tax=Halalkalicoccus jeotgali (strain DSM 18796 / CECT 7217 / JCM 14584 / KCTC 4019 / B3) TaxID=795797 RepID=D8J8F7_HALJB|nr:hypothetical protein [Halalkalicoccus jeotgali]ADJ16203.1 hypothetical protein HacjB3_14110 [Halalkalicoccus jeotgali B3]ELY37631.1 hypothetical protein C497_09328 [Halalkalicoccus jeotgali B3]